MSYALTTKEAEKKSDLVRGQQCINNKGVIIEVKGDIKPFLAHRLSIRDDECEPGRVFFKSKLRDAKYQLVTEKDGKTRYINCPDDVLTVSGFDEIDKVEIIGEEPTQDEFYEITIRLHNKEGLPDTARIIAKTAEDIKEDVLVRGEKHLKSKINEIDITGDELALNFHRIKFSKNGDNMVIQSQWEDVEIRCGIVSADSAQDIENPPLKIKGGSVELNELNKYKKVEIRGDETSKNVYVVFYYKDDTSYSGKADVIKFAEKKV